MELHGHGHDGHVRVDVSALHLAFVLQIRLLIFSRHPSHGIHLKLSMLFKLHWIFLPYDHENAYDHGYDYDHGYVRDHDYDRDRGHDRDHDHVLQVHDHVHSYDLHVVCKHSLLNP